MLRAPKEFLTSRNERLFGTIQASFMQPTHGFIKKTREKPAKMAELDSMTQSFGYVVGPKVVTPIHSVIMGDF